MCLLHARTSCPGTRRYFLAISFSLLVALAAAAENPPIAIEVAGADTLSVRGRQTITFLLSVKNNGATLRLLQLETTLPEEWKNLAPEGPFRLDARTGDFRSVGLLVPDRALAGTYTVFCRLRDVNQPSVEASVTLHFVVLPRTALEVRLLASPQFVTAGESYEARFVVRNGGNTAVRFDFTAEGSPPFPCEIGGLDRLAGAEIAPGVQQVVAVTVHTDGRLREVVRHMLVARVRPRESAEAQLVAATSSVEVLPVGMSAAAEPAHTIRATTTTTGTVGSDKGIYALLQESVVAHGTLDEAGRHKIELDLRKELSLGENPLFDSSDRYTLIYRNPLTEVTLGDYPFSLSPLLAPSSLGRGLQVGVRVGPVGGVALYYEDIWSRRRSRGLGGTLDVTLPRRSSGEQTLYRAGLNALSDLEDHTAFGLWQQFSPFDALALGVDAAVQNDAAGELHPALYAVAEGDQGTLFYRARFVRAWPGFRGGYCDTQSMLASGGVRLPRRNLRLYGAYSLSEGNLAPDPSSPASRIRDILVGLGGTIPGWLSEMNIEGESYRQTDRLSPSGDGYDRDLLRLRWWQHVGRLDVGLSSQVSQNRGPTDGSAAFELDDRISLDFHAATGFRTFASADYNGWLIDNRPGRQAVGWEIGFRRDWKASDLSCWVRNRYFFDATDLSGLLGEVGAKLSHGFPGGQRLSTFGQLGLHDGESEPAFEVQIAFTTPVDIPVSRKSAAAVIEGRVYRVETGEPVGGVIVRLDGLAAMTNRDGAFMFRLPRQGRFYLSVDAARLGVGWIPAQPLPIEIDAIRKSQRLEIGIVRAAAIHGTLSVYGFPREAEAFSLSEAKPTAPPAGKAEPGRVRLRGLGNVLIELSNGPESKRCLTDANGDFDFPQIRPGRYAITVDQAQLPPYHHLEPSSVQIEVVPSESRIVEIQVVQEQRRARMIESESAVELPMPPLTSQEIPQSPSAH